MAQARIAPDEAKAMARSGVDFCWTHWPPDVFGLAKGANAPIAQDMPKRIAVLCDLEAEARGRSAE